MHYTIAANSALSQSESPHTAGSMEGEIVIQPVNRLRLR